MKRKTFYAVLLLSLTWAVAALAHEEEEATGLVAFFGQFHPALVHFPLALLTTAAFAEFLSIVTGKQIFNDTARVLVVLGALGAAVAVPLGLAQRSVSDLDGAYVAVAEIHENLGIATLIVALCAAAVSEWSRLKDNKKLFLVYRIALFGAAGLVILTGFFGGELTHGIGHYSW